MRLLSIEFRPYYDEAVNVRTTIQIGFKIENDNVYLNKGDHVDISAIGEISSHIIADSKMTVIYGEKDIVLIIRRGKDHKRFKFSPNQPLTFTITGTPKYEEMII